MSQLPISPFGKTAMAGSPIGLQPLSATLIYHNPQDYLSLAGAYLSLVPQILAIAYITTFIVTREVDVLLILVGQLLNEFTNMICKHVFQQPRPAMYIAQLINEPFLSAATGTTQRRQQQHQEFPQHQQQQQLSHGTDGVDLVADDSSTESKVAFTTATTHLLPTTTNTSIASTAPSSASFTSSTDPQDQLASALRATSSAPGNDASDSRTLYDVDNPIRFFSRGYGMPSSHAQFMGFWCIALLAYLLLRFHTRIPVIIPIFGPDTTHGITAAGDSTTSPAQGNALLATASTAQTIVLDNNVHANSSANDSSPSSDRLPRALKAYSQAPTTPVPPYFLTSSHTVAERVIWSVLAVLLSIGVAWSRVRLGYHSCLQVTAGLAAGVVWAIVWQAGVMYGLRKAGFVSWLVRCGFGRWLRLRDLARDMDLGDAAWAWWEYRQAVEGMQKVK